MDDIRQDFINRKGLIQSLNPPVARTSVAVIVCTAILALTILILDLYLPLGVAAGVPYVSLVLMGVWYCKPQQTYILATLASVLVIVGYVSSPAQGVHWVVIINQGLTLFAIWVTAIIIVSRKQYEKKLSERTQDLKYSEEHYRDIIEGSDDLITIVDGDGRFKFVNHKAKAIFGIEPEECVGRLAFDFIHPEDRAPSIEIFQNWLKNKKTHIEYENRQQNLDGTVFNMLWAINIRYNQAGDVEVIRSIARDITQRKITEKALAQKVKELDFQKFALDEHAIVSIADVQGNITYANAKFCEISG